jgi:hypothetical protein
MAAVEDRFIYPDVNAVAEAAADEEPLLWWLTVLQIRLFETIALRPRFYSLWGCMRPDDPLFSCESLVGWENCDINLFQCLCKLARIEVFCHAEIQFRCRTAETKLHCFVRVEWLLSCTLTLVTGSSDQNTSVTVFRMIDTTTFWELHFYDQLYMCWCYHVCWDKFPWWCIGTCTVDAITFPDTEIQKFGDVWVCIHLLGYSICTVKTDEGSNQYTTLVYIMGFLVPMN